MSKSSTQFVIAMYDSQQALYRFWGAGGMTHTVIRRPHLMASGLGTLSPPLPNCPRPPASEELVCPFFPAPVLSARPTALCLCAGSATDTPARFHLLGELTRQTHSQVPAAVVPGQDGSRSRGQSQRAAGYGDSPGLSVPLPEVRVGLCSRSPGLAF